MHASRHRSISAQGGRPTNALLETPRRLDERRSGSPLDQRLSEAAWEASVRIWNVAKRQGKLSALEPLLLRLAPRLIPPPRLETTVKLSCGMTMIVPPGSNWARSYAAGLYERDATSVFSREVGPGQRIADVGANTGYYALLASRLVGPVGCVDAFEPDPRNFDCLTRSVAANECRNVVLSSAGVADSEGVRTFVRESDGTQSHITSAARGENCVTIRTLTLDAYYAEAGWPPVSFVKMDIEGGERAALAGMRELSERHPALRLMIELNPMALRRAGATPTALAATLLSLGFRQGRIIEGGMRAFSLTEPLPSGTGVCNLLLSK